MYGTSASALNLVGLLARVRSTGESVPVPGRTGYNNVEKAAVITPYTVQCELTRPAIYSGHTEHAEHAG